VPTSVPSPDFSITTQASLQKHGGLNFMDEAKTLPQIKSLLQDSQQLNDNSLVSESTPDVNREGLASNANSKDLENKS
jgi:hypothetical protein